MKAKLLCSMLLSVSISSASYLKAEALIINEEGKNIGKAVLVETNNGVLIKTKLKSLPPNSELGFHIHEMGKCDPPDFKTAKGHFNPFNKEHGLLNKKGFHAGDMPNVFTDDKGTLKVHILNTKVTLEKDKPNSLLKSEGTAIVIHAKGDDYKSDPSGKAGKRIGCGVIKQVEQNKQFDY